VEATIFTGWADDFLKPHAVDRKVAHPAMLKAITSSKKKNDRADAEKTADLLRVKRLMSIPAIGELTALAWVLKIGDVARLSSSRQTISYCGLCSGQHESTGKERRGSISKKRNKPLQTKLIEAAKLAPHWNEQLALMYEKESARGNRNRTTLVVARKLVEYMLAVDRRGTDFELLKKAV
jgi:transposase